MDFKVIGTENVDRIFDYGIETSGSLKTVSFSGRTPQLVLCSTEEVARFNNIKPNSSRKFHFQGRLLLEALQELGRQARAELYFILFPSATSFSKFLCMSSSRHSSSSQFSFIFFVPLSLILLLLHILPSLFSF